MQILKMTTLTSMLGLTLLSIVPGSAMPKMLFERILPRLPEMEKFTFEMEGRSWYHFGKNIYTELIRADPQWWGKFLFFIILAFSLKAVYNSIKEYIYGKKT